MRPLRLTSLGTDPFSKEKNLSQKIKGYMSTRPGPCGAWSFHALNSFLSYMLFNESVCLGSTCAQQVENAVPGVRRLENILLCVLISGLMV